MKTGSLSTEERRARQYSARFIPHVQARVLTDWFHGSSVYPLGYSARFESQRETPIKPGIRGTVCFLTAAGATTCACRFLMPNSGHWEPLADIFRTRLTSPVKFGLIFPWCKSTARFTGKTFALVPRTRC